MPLLLNCRCMFVSFESQSLSSRRLFAGAVGVGAFSVSPARAANFSESRQPDCFTSRPAAELTPKSARFFGTLRCRKLDSKPPGDIPCDPRRLAAIVADRAVRGILPPQLIGEAAHKRQNSLAQLTGHAVEILKNYLLRWGVVVASVGAALFLLGLAFGIGRPAPAPAPR